MSRSEYESRIRDLDQDEPYHFQMRKTLGRSKGRGKIDQSKYNCCNTSHDIKATPTTDVKDIILFCHQDTFFCHQDPFSLS